MRLCLPDIDRLKLPPGKADHIEWDDELSGFGLRLRAGGKRTWVVQYRAAGRTRRVTIGTVEAINPDKARKAAKTTLARVQLGADPQAEKVDERTRAVVTIGSLGENYLEAQQDKVSRGKLSQRSLVEDQRYIRKDWQPLHDKPAHRLTRAQISDRFDEITKEKGAVTANRARSTLSAMYAWAMKKGKAESNPVAGTEKHEEGSRDRVLNGAELAAIWRACGDDDYGHIVRLLILTGARRDEIAGVRDSELQRDLRVWSLPAERTKNGLPHDVPLSSAALAELPPARDDRDLLFGRADGPFSGWSRCKERLDARIAKASHDGKPLAPWTLHDLRRSCATGMAEIGVQPHIVEAVLNHISGVRRGVAGIYNRAVYAAEKRDALNRWASHIEALISARPANVIAMPAAG